MNWALRNLGSVTIALIVFAWNPQGFAQEFVELELDSALTPRFGLYHQTEENGFVEPYSDLRALLPVSPLKNDKLVLFTDLRVILDNDSNIGFNLGGGARTYFPATDAVWGVNFFADQRDTDQTSYNQLGFGFEGLFFRLECRQNFYFPVGTDRTELGSSLTAAPGATPFFQQNFLSIAATQTTFIEQALKGFDTEVGGPIPGLDGLLDDQVVVRGYVGGYRYDNPDLESLTGISGRLNVNYRDTSEVNVFLQHDRFFGTQVGVGVALYFDKFLSDNFRSGRQTARDHLNRMVQRRQMITVARGAITEDVGTVNLTNVATGQPLTITHVANTGGPAAITASAASANPAGTVAALGTFENPIRALPGTQSTDIVYVHSGSVFNGQTYALADGQRLLGEGNGVTHLVNTAELGTIALPASGSSSSARPVLNNSMGSAVVLANNSEVANFSIVNPTLAGIYGQNVTGAQVNNVSVQSNVVGATVLDGLVFGSSIRANASPLNAAGMSFVDSQVAIKKSTINTTGFGNPGILAEGSDVTVTDSTVTTANGLSPAIQPVNSTITLNNSALVTSGDFSYGISIDNLLPGGVRPAEVKSLASNGINITLNNSTIKTTGIGSTGIGDASLGIFDADLSVQAVAPPGGISITLNNSTINTTGASAAGIGFGSLLGVGSVGVAASANGPLVTLNNSVINTTGELALGVIFENANVTVTGSQITTSGNFAAGVSLGNGALALVNSAVVTNGNDASGVEVFSSTANIQNSTIVTNGNGSTGVDGFDANLTMRNSTVTTDGNDAKAVRMDESGFDITGSTLLAKSGANAEALNIQNGSNGTISGSSIIAHGDDSNAMSVDNSTVTASNNTITGSGANSVGLLLTGSSTATVTGNDITAASDEIAGLGENGALLTVTITSNTLNSGMGTILLDNSQAGTLTVQGFANAAALALSNGIADTSVIEIGLISYNP